MAILSKIKQFDWALLQNLGIIGFLGLIWQPWLKIFFLCYLIGLFKLFKHEDQELPGKDLSQYYKTLLFSQLNPFTLYFSLQQLLGQLIILIKYRGKLPDTDNYCNAIEYILPFEGAWTIVNGGSTRENSHSWDILTQRYAYDFVISDQDGKTYQKEGKRLEDYYCFGQKVISPADGIVVQVQDSIRDYTRTGDYSIDWKARDFRGNFVIIHHSDKEYSFIAHLKFGSISVQEGGKVQAGQMVGLCGNSGHSTEPHIHFHLQDRKDFWTAAGLPIRFKKFNIYTSTEVSEVRENSFAEKNEIVANV